MQFWWVNQGKTFDEESAKELIRAPKANSDGDSVLIVANCPRDEYLGRLIRRKDALWEMGVHVGGVYVSDHDVSLLIASDGLVRDGSDRNLWREYMSGMGTDTILESLRYQLQESRSAEGAS